MASSLLNELAHNINNPLQSLTKLVHLAAETQDGLRKDAGAEDVGRP
jgi:hypothetical protein